jgi:NAD+ diphosphatase
MLRAFHIAQWRQESKSCGTCGTKNIDAAGETARLCPACGRMEFPRIAPAVITIITNNEEKILLAHNKKFAPGIYSLIAGFVEAGESLEAAASREIKEELDIDVKDIRYVRSQSWPFPNSLMVGFTALYKSGELRPDGNEIIDARWFSRETIKQSIAENTTPQNNAGDDSFVPDLPGHGSISRYIIDKWVEQRTEAT